MSTFGEIVEPVSRTTWEDWDDVNSEGSNLILQWQLPLLTPDKIETVVILEGKFLADCIKAQSKENFKLINSITEANLCLYKIKSCEKYVCTVKDYNLLQSSEIIELLKSLLCKSDDVITIQTKPLIEYQTSSNSTAPWIIRKITTSSISPNDSYNFMFGKLEQPNILSGISAGAICLREHSNLPATALIYYCENIEEYQPDELNKLLENISIVQKHTTKFNGVLSSNLYI